MQRQERLHNREEKDLRNQGKGIIQQEDIKMNLFAEAKNVLDKDGKVNALGLYVAETYCREMSTYFRRNKVKDATIKKAVEVALDLGGARYNCT